MIVFRLASPDDALRSTGRNSPGRRLSRVVTCGIIGLFCISASGCVDTGDDSVESPGNRTTDTLAWSTAPIWSREGLEAQPRMTMLQQHASRDPGYTPGTTLWRLLEESTSAADDDRDSSRFDTPGALLSAQTAGIVGSAEVGLDAWEQTIRIWQDNENEAVGVLLRWGFKDDAVTGHDFRMHLRRSDDGWRLDRIEERFHCGRGVSEDGLCV